MSICILLIKYVLFLISSDFQIILGFCKLGVVTTYMSDSLVSGFTTGAAVHVFTSQVKYVFGLKIIRISGMFQLILVSISFIQYIYEKGCESNVPYLFPRKLQVIWKTITMQSRESFQLFRHCVSER